MDNEVTKFEESILSSSPTRRTYPGSKFCDQSGARPRTPIVQTPIVSPNGSDVTTPFLTRGSSPPLSIIVLSNRFQTAFFQT